ncbi:MAG: hypothetical protein HYY93_10605 [Planctomycetes bacterium]|nr:hypothetical protein [Planctomycetota bacterium]
MTRHPIPCGPAVALGLFLASGIALISPLRAQDDKPAEKPKPVKKCSTCRNTRKLPCPHKFLPMVPHPEQPPGPPLGIGPFKCSACLKEKCCNGVGWNQCGSCKKEHPEITEESETMTGRVDGFVKGRAPTDEILKVFPVWVETEHFTLAATIEGMKGAPVSRGHDTAHLYSQRLEQVYTWFAEIFGDSAPEVGHEHTEFLFATPSPHQNVVSKIIKSESTSGLGMKRYPDMFTTWNDKQAFEDDEDFHRDVVHNTAHLLINSYKGYAELPGWLDEGFAHFVEKAHFKKGATYCFSEVPPDKPIAEGDWRPKLKAKVLKKDHSSFSEMQRRASDAMNHLQHAQAWSYVDFLIATDKKKFVAFVDALKAKEEQREAFKKAFDWGLTEFEENWVNYVKSKY